MTVTNDEVSSLGAYLSATSDTEAADAERHLRRLVATGAANSLGVLLYATLVIPARRVFAPAWTSADIIRFAEVRQLLGVRPDVFDPLVAENQLRRALGEQIADSQDVSANARAQLILLNALVMNAELDDDAVFGPVSGQIES